MPVNKLLSADEANRFGFDWPSDRVFKVGDKVPPFEPQHKQGAHVQVTRTSTIDRGKKGVWRVLTIKTERDELNIYIAPKGGMRVFRKLIELK